jgi:hypothetical protein
MGTEAPIEYSWKPSAKDEREALNLRRPWRIFRIVSLFVAALGLFIVLVGGRWLTAGFVVFIPFAIYASDLLTVLRIRRTAKTMHFDKREILDRWDERGLHRVTPTARFELSWPGLTSWREGESVILIQGEDKGWLYVPKSQLDKDQLDAFRAFLKEHLPRVSVRLPNYRWALAIAIILVEAGFGSYWFATVDERACEEFTQIVTQRAEKQWGTGFAFVGVDLFFDAGKVQFEGETYKKPDGCEPPTDYP